jgi:hypothetical protein
LSKDIQKKLANNPITNIFNTQNSYNTYNTTNVYNTTDNSGGNGIAAGTGISVSTNNNVSTISTNFGSAAGTSAEGNKTITCPSGIGNLTGGGNTITIGAGGACNSLGITNNPTFTGQVTAGGLNSSGTITFSGLGQGIVRSSATGELSTNFVQNSDFDSTQIYSNITKLNNVTFGGQMTISNLANGIVKSTGGVLSGGNTVSLGADTTGSYIQNLGTLTGLTTTGNTGAGSTPTIAVAYGSTANTSVQGNTTLICPSGTGNLTGTGNTITLGSGGTCNSLSIVNNPTFTGALTAVGINAGIGSIQGTGGLTVSGGANISGGASITGNSSITGNTTINGTLSGLLGLTVASGGATISSGGLTVSAGGASITGNSSITGNLSTTGSINNANISGGTISGGTMSGGTFTGGSVSGGSLTSTSVNGVSVSGGTISAPTIANPSITGGLNNNSGGINNAGAICWSYWHNKLWHYYIL